MQLMARLRGSNHWRKLQENPRCPILTAPVGNAGLPLKLNRRLCSAKSLTWIHMWQSGALVCLCLDASKRSVLWTWVY